MNSILAAEIRKQALAARKKLASDEIARRSADIIGRFMATYSSISRPVAKVALYRSLPGEVLLDELAKALMAKGASVLFPRIKADGGLEMVEIPAGNPEPLWEPGPYGLQEPHSRFPATDPSLIDLVIVPGAAFGRSGERIGLGAGYYDRFLPQASNALRVALAFEHQLHDQLPQSPWDQRVHWIVSEGEECRSPAVSAWALGQVISE